MQQAAVTTLRRLRKLRWGDALLLLALAGVGCTGPGPTPLPTPQARFLCRFAHAGSPRGYYGDVPLYLIPSSRGFRGAATSVRGRSVVLWEDQSTTALQWDGYHCTVLGSRPPVTRSMSLTGPGAVTSGQYALVDVQARRYAAWSGTNGRFTTWDVDAQYIVKGQLADGTLVRSRPFRFPVGAVVMRPSTSGGGTPGPAAGP